MAYSIGQITGGIVITYIFLRLILLAFGGYKHKSQSIVIAACITLALSTVAAGFGFADGSSPVFLLAFTTYAIPTLISMGIELLRASRIRKNIKAQSQDEVT